MGYYCTVPQCTSLAGKSKNVKFHRFPRDVSMADRWNAILRRGKPYTKYSKVCSLHFSQSDYNVTTMGKNKGINIVSYHDSSLSKKPAKLTILLRGKIIIFAFFYINKTTISISLTIFYIL